MIFKPKNYISNDPIFILYNKKIKFVEQFKYEGTFCQKIIN